MQFDQLKRRDLITLFGGGALAWPLAARAQQTERAWRVGVLEHLAEGDPDTLSMISAFRQRLQELGWSDGRNARIEVRWSGGNADRLLAHAAELVGLKSDVILGRSTPVVAALRHVTETVPIVFVNANDPIRSGFVQSLARPGGNITGFISWDSKMGGKWLELLKEIAPSVVRVALLHNPQTYTGQQDESLAAGAPALGITLAALPFREAVEIERGIDNFARQANVGILVLPDSSTVLHRDLIVKLAGRQRVPAIYPFRQFATSGGLAYYGTNTRHQYRQAAEYIDRILRGAKPADLPVQAPTRYELIINLQTANAIGLVVPPTLLARADEVIE
jgi:putative tryptophan/tyrosine transport system substrate-binding protein